MHPTAFRPTIATLIATLSVPYLASDAAAPQSVPFPESADGLRALVQQALEGLPPGALRVDELLRRLQIVVHVPSALTRLPAYEQLVVVNREGRVMGFAHGTQSSVDKDQALEQLLRTNEGLILIHNHPHERGLSVADLGQLGNRGVASIIAIGHDGSLYAASSEVRGRTPIMTCVRSAVTEVHRVGANADAIDKEVFFSQFEHLVSLVLGDAGVIHYRSALAGARRESFNRFREEFSRLTDEARQRLAADVVHSAKR